MSLSEGSHNPVDKLCPDTSGLLFLSEYKGHPQSVTNSEAFLLIFYPASTYVEMFTSLLLFYPTEREACY